jgi:hypothetical protein
MRNEYYNNSTLLLLFLFLTYPSVAWAQTQGDSRFSYLTLFFEGEELHHNSSELMSEPGLNNLDLKEYHQRDIDPTTINGERYRNTFGLDEPYELDANGEKGWRIGVGAGVAIPSGGLNRDLKGSPRLELSGGKELLNKLRLITGLKYHPLQGRREGLKVNLFSTGLSLHYRTSSTRKKISFLLSGGLGWDWIDRTFQSGKETGNGPYFSEELGLNLPFGTSSSEFDLEGLLTFHHTLSEKSGNIFSFGFRIWHTL